METLPREYTFLFNAISDTEVALRRICTELMNIQRHAEELYLASDPEAKTVIKQKTQKENTA